MEVGRAQKSILNIASTSIGSVMSILVSVLNRIIFLKILDETYLGVSGLFSNILLLFSLVELGIGAALTQMFYKPFANKDYEQLSIVTHTTKVLLNSIGIIILLLTAIFTPCLHWVVSDMNAVPNMRLIFMLYGISSSVTYFWGYYRTIITANQEAYRLVKIDYIWKWVSLVGKAIALYITRNFVVYLAVEILLNIISNYIVRCYVRRKYTFIDYNCKKFMTKSEAEKMGKNVVALSMSRIAVIITNGTDNIIISKFLNLATVGLASNYVMMTQAASSLAESVFGPILSSVGNFCIKENDDRKLQMFQNLNFAAFWVYGLCSIGIYTLSDRAIQLLFGERFILGRAAVLFMCLDIFCIGICRVSQLYRTAEGLFWYGKFRPLIQSAINLVASLILVSATGELWAVYAGTVFSRLCVNVWYDPLIALKHSMHQKPWKFYLRECSYFLVYIVALVGTPKLVELISIGGIPGFILAGVLAFFAINIMFLLPYIKTNEVAYWWTFGCSILKKVRKN